ncbi:MAG: hypothetical protein K2O24_02215 [Muribaculaceae bacterium]|nr:hypothetical protein [Muribaculaceae bacterium]
MEDSLLSQVPVEDLLDDEVYQKLAYEGWSVPEIIRIMKTATADKAKAHQKGGYGTYAKRWLPDYALMPGNDSLYQVIDTTYTAAMRRSIERTVPEDLLNKYWPPLEYIPPRMRDASDRRNPGYFRQPKFKPSCGRIRSVAVHPTDPDRLYVYPDGAGLFKTDDLGRHWVNITDRIPNRSDRAQVTSYGIPVDPDNWDHVFAFANNSTVYETCDGGESWRKIQGATHKSFKRAHCFRDKAGNLKFLGCTRGTNIWTTSTVWISEDTCKTWTALVIPDSLKEVHPTTGVRGVWFQEMFTDPSDRDRIYLPTSRSIFYFDDGAKSEIVNGQRVYNIKRLHFTVHDEAGNRLLPTFPNDLGGDVNNTGIFPCPATAPGNMQINPNNPDQWWFATGTSLVGNASAIYRSEDHGKTWVRLHDIAFGVGNYCTYGNELAGTWLGGFGVNFADTTKVYGCAMSSAKSADGGRTFKGFGWTARLKAQHPDDGKWYYVSAASHNADNHFIASHRSGRIFRCSDGGMLCLDKDYNDGEWFNIGGDLGGMLFYHIGVNEFGDHTIMGNTQDLNGQTYRYGRWGTSYGYEGSEAWINPYTSTCYVSGQGLLGWDANSVQLDSWRTATTKADVVTGSWFFTRSGGGTEGKSFNRCDDYGQSAVNLETILGEKVGVVGKFGLCRDKGRCTVYVITASNTLKRSIDAGDTFEPVMPGGTPLKYTNASIATDPDNSDIVYIAQPGKVFRLDVTDGRTTDLSTGLPSGLACTQLMFHEGSGDLYFYNAGSGTIYILEYDKTTGQYADAWRFWVKGFNGGKSRNAVINYTSQEMAISEYGISVWCADLEHPSDRFFENGFPLRELSFKDGRHTIGIDTEWTIPLYYYYKWTVNGEDVNNPYQYLRRKLEPGDRVRLELTLRESPDVVTTSAEFIVPATGNKEEVNPGDTRREMASAPRRVGESGGVSYDNPVIKVPGHYIYSNGKGRVDLGYMDYFFGDFTIDFWVKPLSDGSLLGNTSATGNPKGFEIKIDAGNLKLTYYPRNVTGQPYYEEPIQQSATLTAPIEYSKWSHVAITHQRYGEVAIYINGEKLASGSRILSEEGTLNNAVALSLFADAIERLPIEASFDELKIWTKALDEDQIRREMYSTNAGNKDGLAAYYPFNGGSLENDVEAFSRHGIRSRIRAEVQHQPMNIPICAKEVIYESINGVPAHTFSKGDKAVLGMTATGHPAAQADAGSEAATGADLTGSFGVYVYDASQWQNEEDNLDTDYFDYYPLGYLVHPFGGTDLSENIDLEFHPYEGEFDPDKLYRLYVADANVEKQVWEKKGSVKYNAQTGGVTVSGISLADIADKKILVTTTRPSIEIKIDGIGEDGILSVYDDSNSTFKMTANVLANLATPADVYNIESDGILRPSGLYFVGESATGELRLDLSKLGPLNTTVRSTLRSNDNAVPLDSTGRMRPSLIPLTVDVRNRISPRPLGTGLRLNRAVAEIGNLTDYKALMNSNNFTVMGWVRVDDPVIINTGGYSLMTWRDSGNRGNGLMLNKGKLCGVVNWVKLSQSSMGITPEDLGNWVHLAFVVTPTQIKYYKNGIEEVINYKVNPINTGVGPFCLGKTTAAGTKGNDNFDGAFEQVAAWSRSLTKDEIVKYMYSTVPLDDPGLMVFSNMDFFDEHDIPRDCYNTGEIKITPTAALAGEGHFNEVSTVPYDARAIVDATAQESPVSLDFPAGKGRQASVATFRGAPYCYLNHDFQEYVPLNQEFYGITYTDPLTAAKMPQTDETVNVTYRHHAISGDDLLAVALRRTGTFEHLSGFIHATNVTDGEATFSVPASYLTEASEMMFFTYPAPDGSGTHRPANIQLALGRSILSNVTYENDKPVIVLQQDMNTIPVIADIIGLGSSAGSSVSIKLDNDRIASLSQDKIDFSAVENLFNITIDREKIDPFKINTVTLDLEGPVKSNVLEIGFCLSPYVHLTLENGEAREVVTPIEPEPEESGEIEQPGDEDPIRARLRALAKETASQPANSYRSSTPVANLEISAELKEGYLPPDTRVELEVISDMPTSFSLGNGNLLNDQAVRIGDLRHYDSPHGSYHEGWNLVGNPYLTNINLTKEQNVKFDPSHVTRFLYHCDAETGNYEVFDMTSYNAGQLIVPFQSYFVQTMVDGAEFTVTPVAKEVTPTKHTRAYTVNEKKEISLALMADGKTYDRVSILLDNDASDEFVTGEDAAKMWNITGSSPEICAMTIDGKEAAINSVDASAVNDIPLLVKGAPGRAMILECTALTGFGDIPVRIRDNVTKEEWVLEPGTDISFTLPSAVTYRDDADDADDEPEGKDPRFTVILNDYTTGMDTGLADNGYNVYVTDRTCTVTGLHGDSTVSIFTANGVKMTQQHTHAPSFSLDLESGVFIVTIHENGKDYVSKIMVQ